MKSLVSLLKALLFVVAAICLLLAATSCSTTRIPVAADARVDSTLRAAGVPALGYRRVKINGNVYLQSGQGNTLADNTNAGRKGAAATAPNAVATSAPRQGGLPWQVVAGGALVLLGLGFFLRGRLKLPLPF